jgi:(1->4)-alpha-D-glucan 1-alpha-D-glucosylmutase
MRTPHSTYRLQIRPSFTLQDAADLVPYLADLGVDWVYLSPILTAEEGSDHGYDVTDPTAVDPARGGPEGLKALSDAAHAAGLGVLVDIVPNHMGIATPHANAWWWSVLAEGRGSRYAEAFDIDWDAGNGKLRLPILGDGDDELAELKLAGGELHYYGHRFPVAEGTAGDGDSAQDVHARQHYELVNWRRADNELNYRRFFGVNTLAGIRVEEPWVFDESHAEIKRWFDEGLVDGLRIDHPDGLADPKGYLARLRKLTNGAYILVEKILEPGETLPADWETEGTTGYDALADIDRLFVDPEGMKPLTDLVPTEPFAHMIHGTKRNIADHLLHSEVLRLVRLLPEDSGLDAGVAADAVAELLACFPVYRSYLPEGAGYLADAVTAAKVRRPDLAGALDVLHPLLNPLLVPGAESADLGEFAVRFQQTSGMVMAKGVEDTAFYRYSRLTSLNEVGADPAHFALEPFELHTRLIRRHQEQPAAMTTLTTHDTKRSEDTRARISVLAEIPDEWRDTFTQLSTLVPMGDPAMENLLWQAIIGAWPLSRERAHAYAEKASREASSSTTWTAPDTGFEDRMHAAIDAAYDNPAVASLVTAMVERTRSAGYSNSLSAKLLQLTMPGVPDVYQGTEFWDRSLVDPDNRRDVDFSRRREVLNSFAAGTADIPGVNEEAAAKMLLVARALGLKRSRPELFGDYLPVSVTGPAAAHVFGFDRGGAVTLVTRLPLGLDRNGGWRDTAVVLPAGRYVDVITGRAHKSSGTVPAADLFGTYPAALLERTDGE